MDLSVNLNIQKIATHKSDFSDLDELPSAQPEIIKRTAETEQNIPNGELISRKAAIEALGEEPIVWDDDADYELGQRSQWKADKLAIESVPPEREAKLNEWCTDCKEYDQERHCCPRWNRVIRNTVEEIKADHRWIPVTERLPKEDYWSGLGKQYSKDVLMSVFNLHDEEEFIDVGHTVDGQWYSAIVDRFIEKSEDWYVTAWKPLPEPWKPLPEPWKGEEQ